MKCTLISIGDELLIGQTVNTNASWIGEQLNNLGFSIVFGAVISDDKAEILNTLYTSSLNSDIIIMTGGLGPTKDDITKHTLCEYFETSLVLNLEIEKKIIYYFQSVNRPILKSNKDQALLPENCTILPNSRGTASGMWFEKENKIYISLPGVPYEMKGIMQEYVFPKLLSKIGGEKLVLNKTIRTHGMGESFLAEIIKSWEDDLVQSEIKLAYLPSPGIVKLRLTAIGINNERLKDKLELATSKLKDLIPNEIYGYENATMEGVVGELLIKKKCSLATAESCTGGSVAKMITSISGSSSYFNGSIVSYSNDSKINLLGVKNQTLIDYGAVSKQVVEEMAVGVKSKLKTDYGISTSGIAGPGGGSKDKPVGTVWIAVSGKNGVVSKKLTLGYNRERNIHVSSLSVLNLLRLELLKI